jgi:transketolase
MLTLLYQEYMNIPALDDPDRDRLVLSKGHAAPMLYRNLIEKGYLPEDSMNTLRRIDSLLQGHPSNHTPGVEMPSGPLGLGLAASEGMAIGLRLNNSPARVFCILGDGELNEGCVWEAALSTAKFNLTNLTAIVDLNGVQLDGTTEEVMPLGDLAGRWQSCGWTVISCDGHDLSALYDALESAKSNDKPTVILARTIKGKGVSFMEGSAAWHGQPIPDADLETALAELQI